MSQEMRLLILTHLRAALERKDKAEVNRALTMADRYGDTELADQLYAALHKSSWAALEGIYVALGGIGCGAPGKAAQRPEIAVSVGVGGMGA